MRVLILLACLLPASAWAAEPSCTTTLNPGDNAGSTINSASGGAVICLNSGTYGSYSINNRPSSRVTIRSTSGTGASIAFYEVYRSTNLTFKNLTIREFQLNDFGNTPYSSNISIVGSILSSDTAYIFNFGCCNTNANIVLYGNTIGGTYLSTGIEGQITTTRNPSGSGSMGIKFEHNVFDGTGTCADGIQMTGNSSGITIGPGNIFRDWRQGDSRCPGSNPPHVDAIQFVGGGGTTIEGNYFVNNTIHLGIYDGADDVIVRNNIFDEQADSAQALQLGGIDGMTISHNTFRDVTNTGIGTKSANSPNTNWIIENNILVNSTLQSGGDQPGCGTNCIKRYNLIDEDSSLSVTGGTSTNNINDNPIFVSGSPTTDWATWALDSSSPGYQAGNDGKDMGVLYRNVSAPTGFE